MKLHDQDRKQVYEYIGQKLFCMPVPDEAGELWGINLYMVGVDAPLGTFDTVTEAVCEMEEIESAITPEYSVSGYCEYNGEADYAELCKYIDMLEKKVYESTFGG